MLNKFYDITTKIMKKAIAFGKESLINQLVNLENKFHDSVNSKNWHVKDRRTRRLWTPFGDIKFTRRIYINVHTGEQKILFDKSIGLIPFLYIQPVFFMQFITALNKVSSYKSLTDIFGNEFSTTQISNILKRQDMFLTSKKLLDKTKLLFVNLDDIFLLCHKEKKTKARCAVAYTGTRVKNGRNILVNKTLIPINPDISVPKQVEEFEKTLMDVYGEIKKVVIIGDGANWITTFKNNIISSDAERYIDQFHYKKYVRDMLGHKVKVDWNYFISLPKEKAMFYILSLVGNKNGEPDLKQPKLLSKVNKWFGSFVKCTINKYPNVIEGIQSTQIARTLKNRRAFSKENVYKMLLINAAQYNDWEITFEKPQENIFNFNQNKSIIKSLTTNSRTNVPVLEDKTTTLTRMINHIVG